MSSVVQVLCRFSDAGSAPVTGVRKAPRHEIASGDGASAVPHAAGAADGYGDLVAGPAIRLE